LFFSSGAAFLWLGAKIHFFTRMGATSLEGYLREHWPFWAGMAIVGVLLFAVGTIERRGAGEQRDAADETRIL
jgi:hypothetical protein